MTIIYSAPPLVNSPYLLATMKCFYTQSFFSGILLALQNSQKTLGYQVFMNADQLLNQNRLSIRKILAGLTRNENRLLQCK